MKNILFRKKLLLKGFFGKAFVKRFFLVKLLLKGLSIAIKKKFISGQISVFLWCPCTTMHLVGFQIPTFYCQSNIVRWQPATWFRSLYFSKRGSGETKPQYNYLSIFYFNFSRFWNKMCQKYFFEKSIAKISKKPFNKRFFLVKLFPKKV